MDRGYGNEIIEDDVTRIVRQAFGIDEDRLLRDFLLAQTEIGDDQIPPESEDGFARLLGKLKERSIQPKYLKNSAETEFASGSLVSAGRRPRRLKRMVRVAAVAAVLMTMVFGMSITARARKWYAYNVREREVAGADIIYNKATALTQDDSLEKAYQQIQDELGIETLRLTYLPKGMLFKKLNIGKNSVTMVFEYNGKNVYIVQRQGLDGSSYNVNSDRKQYSIVYNSLCEREIPIQINSLVDGEKEFQVQIIAQDNCYLIEGVMEYPEFEQIIEGVYISQ